MTMDQRFPGKENPLQKRFYIAVAQRSVEEDDTILSKVAKAEGKTRGKKMEKPQNVLRSKTTNRQTAFKL